MNNPESRQAFVRGMQTAQDPQNAARIAKGRAVTTLRSPWLYHYCVTCGHTFRPGDAVRFDEKGLPRHDMGDLPCAGSKTGHSTTKIDAAAFFAGLEQAWPLPAGLRVVRLLPGHPLLAPPERRFRRHTCFVCSHTLRAMDCVVLCPCGLRPDACEVAIHQDIYQSRLCFRDWSPSQNKRYCPATSREIDA